MDLKPNHKVTISKTVLSTSVPDHLRVGGGVEPRLQEAHGRDGGAVVVQGREEAVVAAHVEHVDQTVPGNGREQQQKSDYFDDNDGN